MSSKDSQADILVTIGVPCYNAARFLAEALASAFAQTHAKLEIIVYDDGSSDSSLSLLRDMDDPRLLVIEGGKNAGVATARQVIKTRARGDYLTWLDADDRFHPERIEVLLAEALASAADLVTDNACLIDEAGARLPGLCRVPDRVAADPHFTRILERNVMLAHPLITRRCFRSIDFDLNLTTSEDYDYWLSCSLAGFTFRRFDRALMDYRITAGSLSSNPAASRAALARILAKYSVGQLEAVYRERGFGRQAIDYMACLQYLFRGDYASALCRAQQPWLIEPDIDRDFYIGSLALRCGDAVLAEQHLGRHLMAATDSPAGLNNLGVLLADRGEDATAYWRQALEVFPNYADARINLAGGRAITLTQLPAGRYR
jgi:glycosyltransferase involved in cell wall biosynthesis